MILGTAAALLTALTLGANNVLAAIASRRLGSLSTTVASLTIALVVLLGVVVLAGLRIPTEPALVARLGALAVFAAVSYLAVYEALRLGPVSVISPLTATSGAATTILATIVLGERPTPVQWVSIPLLVIGTVATSIVVDAPGERGPSLARGALLAAVGVFAGAVSNVGLVAPIHEVGAIEAITIQRVITVLLLGGWVAIGLLRGTHRPRGRRTSWTGAAPGREWLIVALIGVLDAVGFVAFALGLTVAPAWLVGLVSQSGRIAATWAGATVFRERVSRTQWLGTGLIVLGVLGVAVGEAAGS